MNTRKYAIFALFVCLLAGAFAVLPGAAEAAVGTDIKANGSDGPITIPAGTSATLTWTSTGAASCTVTPGGFTGTSGSASTGNLTQSQTFLLLCLGTDPSEGGSDFVAVNVQSQPTITADIKANGSDGPITIPFTSAANLTWTSTGATSCTVTPGGFTGISGSASTGNLTQNVNVFTLNCTGSGGSATDQVTVNVIQSPIIPTVDLKVNGQDGTITVASGTAVTLSWTSTATVSCTASGSWSGAKGLAGSETTAPLTASQSYTITCTSGTGHQATDTVGVSVTQVATPSVDLKANGQDGTITVSSGTAVVLSWVPANVTSCTASGSWSGSKATFSSSETTSPLTSNQTYTITCVGTNGQQVADTVNVNISTTTQLTADIKANGLDGSVTIQSGQSVQLTWTSTGATSCTVFPNGFTGVNGNQSTGVLTSSQTYQVVCLNSTGQSAQDSVTVNVTGTQTPTVTLNANPGVINQGQSSVLVWNSQNATTCFASSGSWSGTKSLNGSEQVFPQFTATYQITCTNSTGQQAQAVATVVVNQTTGQTPTLTLTANPTSVNQGQTSVLSWFATNVTNCSVSGGWSGNRNISGSENVYPSITTTYSMTCSGSNGSVSQQATVFVNSQGSQPTVTLTASPNYLNAGQSSVLSWVSYNANSCYASGGWSGNRNISGSQVVFPSFTTTYTITCSNSSGIASASAVITVGGTTVGLNATIQKNTRNITLGQTVFSTSIEAQGLDTLEFEIRVRNTDTVPMQMTVRDILPQQVLYLAGSTLVNDVSAADGITTSGLSLGTLNPQEQRIIRFRAQVFYGTTEQAITNQASAVTPAGTVQNGFATIVIRNRVLGIIDIPPTGPGNPIPLMLFFGFVGSIAFHVAVFKKGAIRLPGIAAESGAPTAASAQASTLEDRLHAIRAAEKQPDTAHIRSETLKNIL